MNEYQIIQKESATQNYEVIWGMKYAQRQVSPLRIHCLQFVHAKATLYFTKYFVCNLTNTIPCKFVAMIPAVSLFRCLFPSL